MPIKVTLEIVDGERTSRSSIEIPFNSAVITDNSNPDYQRIHKCLVDFASTTLTSVLGAPIGGKTATNRPEFGSHPKAAIKIEDDADADTRKRKRTAAEEVHQVYTIGSKDFVNITICDYRTNMSFKIDRSTPVYSAVQVSRTGLEQLGISKHITFSWRRIAKHIVLSYQTNVDLVSSRSSQNP